MSQRTLSYGFRRLAWQASLLLGLIALVPGLAAETHGYWHTSGNQILDQDQHPVRIAAINWFGFETPDQLAHGLWYQDYRTILHSIKELGFNTVRIPFSNQMIEQPILPSLTKTSGGINGDLVQQSSLQILDHLIQAAGHEGLKVILDNHRSEVGDSNEHSGLWYSARFPESAWIADWALLAYRYRNFTDASGNPTVIGMDLRNEPFRMVDGAARGSCWTGDPAAAGCPRSDTAHNWPAAAERAAAAVLAINPNLLIFVEGIDCYNHSCNWEGGNLEGAGQFPVLLSVPNRLVYSAHDYGPSVSKQPWFNSATTSELLESRWQRNWAYLSEKNIAPVWLGEFGTPAPEAGPEANRPGSEGQWFHVLIGFLQSKPQIGWSYWALNGEDASGLFTHNYLPPAISSPRMADLASIEPPAAPLPTPAAASSAAPAAAAMHAHMPGTDALAVCGGLSLSIVALALAERPGQRRRKSTIRRKSDPLTASE